jgi:malate dehydrogenase (oxaloacetate-decarboxylating)
MDIDQQSLELHKKLHGKIGVQLKTQLQSREDLSLLYTPGVAAPCREIAKSREAVWQYTNRGNTVAVVTDGSAVLGLGNIGPEAALPVMEGKALLFKEFGGVDAWPICLDTQDTEEIVQIVKAIAPSFGGINLEDIAAPRCFEIEARLEEELHIPVFHDDQHGTAIVVFAGMLNALKVTERDITNTKFVVSGVGAAGVAIIHMLQDHGAKHIIAVDSKGIVSTGRDDLNIVKKEIAASTNANAKQGTLADALVGADAFIGVSAPDIVTKAMVQGMAPRAIVFALANPTPEIMPDVAKAAGAEVVASGRSDFPNQVNNVLAFPGVFRGALDSGATAITQKMKLAAAEALATAVVNPTAEKIIPDVLERSVAERVAEAVRKAASA